LVWFSGCKFTFLREIGTHAAVFEKKNSVIFHTKEKENKVVMSVCFRYDDFYFLTEPSEFINSHFPDDKTWQLLTTPITMEEFETRPLKTSAFYQFGLTLTQPKQYKTITGIHTHTQNIL